MALPDYVRLLDEIATWEPIVSLFGGEPLLYPDILPLVREIKKRGLTCTIITNGGRLEAYARELVEAGIDSIAISIDGPEEVHNRIRGKADAYQKAAAGVRAVARLAREAEAPDADADRDPSVTELNLDAIPAAVEALRELPLDTINVGLRWFVPKNGRAPSTRR